MQVAAISEVKRPGSGMINENDYNSYWSGNLRGVATDNSSNLQ